MFLFPAYIYGYSSKVTRIIFLKRESIVVQVRENNDEAASQNNILLLLFCLSSEIPGSIWEALFLACRSIKYFIFFRALKRSVKTGGWKRSAKQ